MSADQLSAALRKAVSSGRFNYLSIAPSSDGKTWDVAYIDVKGTAGIRYRAPDIVDAILGAIGTKPAKAPSPPPAPKRDEDLV